MKKPEHNLLSNLFAGSISGLMTVIAGISYATLIFSGAATPFLQLGIASALISATVIGCIVALRSSSPIAIAGPDANISAIIALVVAGVAAKAADAGGTAGIGTLLWVTLAACSLCTGVFLFFMGRFRLGRWIRFIPYPVVGGFLAGTGWLLLRGSFKVMCSIPLSLKTISALVAPETLIHWLPGLIFSFLLLAVLRRWNHFLIMPSVLIGAIVVTHIVLIAAGMPLSIAMNKGWLLSPFPADLFVRSFASLDLQSVDITLLTGNLANIAALMIVAAIVILLNAASVELTTRRDVELDRELITTGIANALAAPLGALTGCTALSRTIMNFKAGATSRVSGVASALTCALLLLVAAPALSLFPRPVLGGLLAYLGLALLFEWVWDGWKRLSRFDYFLVVAIIIIIALWGFLPGVGIGLVVACMLFAINYSRTGPIREVRSGNVFHSNVERSIDQQERLRDLGKRIYILQLQGYLFFGTAFPLLTHLRNRLLAQDKPQDLPEVRYVVLDFVNVAGLDSSAILSFSKLLQFARSREVQVIFVNMQPVVRALLEQGNCLAAEKGTAVQPERGIVLPDLDYALQWCEDRLLGAPDEVRPGAGSAFPDHLARLFPRPEIIPRLLARLDRLDVKSGFVLFEQGAASANLYFVVSGAVTAYLQLTGGARRRLRTMSGGTVIGEMGLYAGDVRSATVIADTDSVLLRLSADAIAQIEREDLELACAMHRFFVNLLSKRLMHANEELAVMGR